MTSDQSGGKPPVDSNCVVLIPKHLRLECVDALGCDRTLPNLAFRIYVVIQAHLNNRTGETYISHERIAQITGHNIRTVQRAIDELEGRGVLIVIRRELAPRKSDGRRVCGGRGTANVYRLAIDRVCAMGTNRGQVLVRRAEQIQTSALGRPHPRTGEQGGRATAANDNERRHWNRPSADKRTASEPEKVGVGAVPTLTDPTDHNSSAEKAAVGSVKSMVLPAEVVHLLRHRSRDAALIYWLCEISCWRIEGRTVTLVVRSRFYEDNIRTRYGDEILQCWRRVQPDLDRLAFVVQQP